MRIQKHNSLCSVNLSDKKLPGSLSKLSQLKTAVFSWPLLFLGAFLVLLVLTIFPWDRLIGLLRANEDEIETISLYAHSVNVDQVSENYEEGWWQTENADLSPDLGRDAGLLEYSNENSSFYAGGNYSLVFSAFKFLKETDTQSEEESLDSTQEESVDDAQDESVDEGVDESESLNEEENDGVTQEESPVLNENEEVIEDEGLGQEGENVGADEEVIIDNESSKSDDDYEIIESEDEQTDDVQIVPEAEILNEDLSAFYFLKNIFGTTEAVAQEYLTANISKLEELGEYKSAKIRLSLAIGTVGGDNQTENDIIYTEDIEADLENELDVTDSETNESESINTDVDGDEADVSNEQSEAEPSEGEQGNAGDETLNQEENQVEIMDVNDESGEVEAMNVGEELSQREKLFDFIKSVNAQEESMDKTKLILWYSLDEAASVSAGSTTNPELWKQFDTLNQDSFSSALNGDYLTYDAEFLKSWEDIEKLKIKVEAIGDDEQKFIVYLDSVWVDADYDPETELEKIAKRQRFEEALKLISEQTVFEVSEDGTFVFQYQKNEQRIWDTLSEMVGIGDFWKDVVIYVDLYDSSNNRVDMPMSVIFDSFGEMNITLDNDDKKLLPGKYTLRFHIEDNSGDEPEIFDINKDFYWGVLVINTDKDVYKSGDSAFVQMAVLDEGGHTVCDAELELTVTDPDGEVMVINNTEVGEQFIKLSDTCGPETVTYNPDYYINLSLDMEGDYELKLKAKTISGEKQITRKISVLNSPLTITRESATRIYPKDDYEMKINIRADEDFFGEIKEQLPSGFKIKNYEIRLLNQEERDPFGGAYMFSEQKDEEGNLELVWQDVELSAGDELEITYIYDAPDKSPEIFALGPIVFSEAGEIRYTEKRVWQLASDSLKKRAKTVMFAAGTYSGGAAAGQSTNADYTFSAFNWRLAESGVDIRNAFVIFETQFEAYNSTGGNYTGYKLGFDACEETCTAAAFGSGDGQVLDNNSNILAYDEIESNYVKLLLDVTNETAIASYLGDGVEVESQIGYHLKNGTTKTSIANAQATLVVTYEYDDDSENLTNTVAYPLDSTNGTDNGSRQAVLNGACTRNNNCPVFDYNMSIPEFPGVATTTNKVSQWFKIQNHNDLNATTDLEPNLNIQTFDFDSPSFHFESANGNNGNMPGMIFPGWTNSGYAENSAQQLEFYINSVAYTNYIIGGEVYETYMASSSAPLKTRTVVLPIGIISNGGVLGLNSANTDVFFPENGNANGVVDVKKAWFRIKGHNFNSTALNIQVSSKVGVNATSPSLTYNYNGNGSVMSPLIDIIHIIPEADYAELENANRVNPKNVVVNATQSATSFGGISAELVITYTYSSESQGYLSNISLFAGQSSESPLISTTTATAPSVMPEAGGKTVYSAGIWSSFLNSASNLDVGAGTVFQLDTNLSSTTPTCARQYRAAPDGINSYTEFYKNVTPALGTEDRANYYACYVDDETLVATDGAKMNGILSYTYGWENTAPTSSLFSAVQKIDGSNAVDISIGVFDIDGNDTRAKLDYATGTACTFSPASDAQLDENDANISAVHGDPYIENDNIYQIGTENGYIKTASGSNTVDFDWLAGTDLNSVEGDYCLRIVANDMMADQVATVTKTLYIDTKKPTNPGALSMYKRTGTEFVLNFGATSTETNFKEYKIFYKVFNGSDPNESDFVLSSSTDPNLANKLFNSRATTSISGLSANQTYSFAVWAYDNYGNKASSSRVDLFTNDAPVSTFNSAVQKNNGSGVVDISFEADDLNNNDTLKAKLLFATGTTCSFVVPGDPTLDENPASSLADFGLPTVTNANEYQIGDSGAWIITSPGSNTISLDWLANQNLPNGNQTYCLGLILNDSYDDQLVLATTTLTIDNVLPVPTGSLSEGLKGENDITLVYAIATPATDTNEPATNAYKIFYKQGTSGVSEADTEIDRSELDAYDYNGATSTVVGGLDQNTWYVFKIFSYDNFGNKSSSTEIAIKTNASVSNQSLSFLNPASFGFNYNIAVAGPQTWTMRAVVKETNGYFALASTTLRLANENDNESPYNDFVFTWNQSNNQFSEIGNDTDSLVSLSPSSASNCSGDICELDFVLTFSKDLISSSVNFDAELITGNDSLLTDTDVFNDFYQVRVPYLEQIHYRWRNDDGGE